MALLTSNGFFNIGKVVIERETQHPDFRTINVTLYDDKGMYAGNITFFSHENNPIIIEDKRSQ